MKPKVYVETSVIGYLTTWPSGNLVTAARQKQTKDWWREASDTYELVVSDLVVSECSVGDPEAIRDRQFVLKPLREFAATDEARTLARMLIAKGAVPASEPEDSLHIAIAVVNAFEYLVTWNFKHIANASMKSRIYDVCKAAGYSQTTICSPDEL